MRKTIIFASHENDAALADWVAARIPGLGFDGRGFDPCTCIGVLRDGQLIAAVVYHGWMPQWGHIQISMAADDPRWARREIIKGLLGYPFSIGCHRINLMTNAENVCVNKLVKGLGFVREGTHVSYFGYGKNAFSWRMLKSEYSRVLRRFGSDDRVVSNGQRRQGREFGEAA